MEDSKIELFEEENGKSTFPKFDAVSSEKCYELQVKLKERLNLDVSTDLVSLVKSLYDAQKHLPAVDANEEGFSLLECIRILGVDFDSQVLVNWYRFDDIDEFALNDLSKYFDDIWFPGSDDIDIFDDSLNWIVSIRHDGQVFVLN